MHTKIALSILVCATLVNADENLKTDSKTLERVVVVATKSENSQTKLSTQVEIISAEEIQNNAYVNTADIFANTPSIQTSPDGSKISLRGMAHNDTLMLIDGRRIVGEFEKKYELERIPAGMIERIEILKGSSSVLYGTDAMGGVINIITKKSTEELRGSAKLVLGDDKEGVDIFISGSKNNTSYKLYASYLNEGAFSDDKTAAIKVMQSATAKKPSELNTPNASFTNLKNNLPDSYTQEQDYTSNLELVQVGFGLSHRFNDTVEIGIDGSYMSEDKDGAYVADSYPTNYMQGGKNIMAKNIFAHEYNENLRKNIGAFINLNPLDNLDINYDISYSKYEKDRISNTPLFSELGYLSQEDGQNSVNLSELSKTIHNFLTTYVPNEDNTILIGSEYQDSKNRSNSLNTDRDIFSIFAQHEYKPLEDLNLVYGARYDDDSVGDSQTSLSAGFNYALLDTTHIRANYAQGFKTPEDRDLYVNQVTPSGVMNYGANVIDGDKTTAHELVAETSETFELGAVYNNENLMFDLGVYQTDVEDKIEKIKESGYFTFKNIDEVQIQGAEATLSAYIGDILLTKLYYTAIDARDRSDDSRLTYTPKEAASLSLSYFATEDTETKLTTKYTGEQETDTETLGGYALTNIKFIANNSFYDGLDLYAGIDNIFSKKLDEEIGRIAEAYYYVGAKYSF